MQIGLIFLKIVMVTFKSEKRLFVSYTKVRKIVYNRNKRITRLSYIFVINWFLALFGPNVDSHMIKYQDVSSNS